MKKEYIYVTTLFGPERAGVEINDTAFFKTKKAAKQYILDSLAECKEEYGGEDPTYKFYVQFYTSYEFMWENHNGERWVIEKEELNG